MDEIAARLTRLEQAVQVLRPTAAVKSESSAFGVAVINRVGAVTLAIGIIFFFKYAVDEHLIGAWSGVMLGILFGFALLGGGEWLSRQQQRVFAQGISGCGLASLYISVYAAVAFYKLIGEATAFAALTAVSAAAFALSVRNRSAAIAMMGVVGGILTPLLLDNKAASTAIQFAFVLFLNGTALAIAVREQWRGLVSAAGVLSLVTIWILWSSHHTGLIVAFAVALAAFQFGVWWRTQGAIRNEAYVNGHTSLLLGCMQFVAAQFVQISVISETNSVLLIVYGIVLLTYGMLRESLVNRRLGLVLVALVILKLYIWDIWWLDRFYRISAFLGLGALLLLASWVYSRTKKRA